MKTITVICGGRGASTIIPSLIETYKVNAIVNAYDDGRSTGLVRHVLNILGPSDIRKVQELGMPENSTTEIKKLMAARVPFTCIDDLATHVTSLCKTTNLHRWGMIAVNEIKLRTEIAGVALALDDSISIANLVYAGCILDSGNRISIAAQKMGIELSTIINVVPSSDDVLWLAAVSEDGKEYPDEASIVEERSVYRIRELILHNDISFYKQKGASKLCSIRPYLSWQAIDAIVTSDLVVIAPGTVHSSIYPTLMHQGLEPLLENKPLVIITNASADVDTPNYTAEDYVRTITKKYRCVGKPTVAVCASDGETVIDVTRISHWCDEVIKLPLLVEGKHRGQTVARIIEQILDQI